MIYPKNWGVLLGYLLWLVLSFMIHSLSTPKSRNQQSVPPSATCQNTGLQSRKYLKNKTWHKSIHTGCPWKLIYPLWFSSIRNLAKLEFQKRQTPTNWGILVNWVCPWKKNLCHNFICLCKEWRIVATGPRWCGSGWWNGSMEHNEGESRVGD